VVNRPVVTENDQRKPDPRVLIGGGVVGLVGIALGTGFAVASNAKASKSYYYEQAGVFCMPPDRLCAGQFYSLQREKVNFAGASMWTFIAGGAMLAGTGVYAAVSLLSPKRELKAQVTLGRDEVGAALVAPW
jgi:hypothetical protein